jgi:hypothetical protein
MLKLNARTTHEAKTAAEQFCLLYGTDVSVTCCCVCCYYEADLHENTMKNVQRNTIQLAAKIMNAFTEKKNRIKKECVYKRVFML